MKVLECEFQTEYPVLWEAGRFEKIALSAQAERHGLAYVVGRSGIVSDFGIFELGGLAGRNGWSRVLRCDERWACE